MLPAARQACLLVRLQTGIAGPTMRDRSSVTQLVEQVITASSGATPMHSGSRPATSSASVLGAGAGTGLRRRDQPDQLADAAMSKYHYLRTFRASLARRRTYLWLRLRHAALRLRDRRAVLDIAFDAGFATSLRSSRGSTAVRHEPVHYAPASASGARPLTPS